MGQQPFRLTPEQMEERRLFAASLLKSGWRPADVADECGTALMSAAPSSSMLGFMFSGLAEAV